MGLKKIMSTLKRDGYIVKRLDQYLLSMNEKDEDRRWDINSPSSAGKCPRAVVYSRLNYDRDTNSVDARTRRIFDNGTGVHERLQKYMLDSGILAMDEVPLFDDELQIQGHTDGLLNLSKFELGVLEIKSINSNSFSKLVDAKEEHKLQAITYMYCLENRRKWLKDNYETEEALNKYLNSKKYKKFIEDHYKHIKDGSKFSAEEKHQFKLECHQKADRIMWNASRPINKMVFLYENKDNQELKEFTVKYDEEMMATLIEKYEFINDCVFTEEIPPRPKECTSKMCSCARWCSFKLECWIV